MIISHNLWYNMITKGAISMYLNILKKDLKRKKTMNLIILLFVILTAMFFSSGMNNIIAVLSGVDRFLDQAGMGDHVIFLSEPEGNTAYRDSLDRADFVSSYRSDTIITVSPENVLVNGKRQKDFSNLGCIQTVNRRGLKFFDVNDTVVTDVPKGKVLVTASIAKRGGYQTGDRITAELCGETLELEYAGIIKDAVLGSPMMNSPRFLISADDFRTFSENRKISSDYRYCMYYIETETPEMLSTLMTDPGGVLFSDPRSTIKLSYMMHMLVAGITMAVSIALILIAFVVLRFTINFTMTEEFREIGVMKAIGLKSRLVRGFYLLKYLFISVIGAAIGFFASIPFGNMLLRAVSSDMVLSSQSPVWTALICTPAVICVIMLFCWNSTAKIRKLSPVDAVRSGQTGERFGRKGLIHLSDSRFGANLFLSINDIFSTPKQSCILTAVLTLCITLVMILSTTAHTLAGEGLIGLVGCTASDAYLELPGEFMEITNGTKNLAQVSSEIEEKLSENGMPGAVRLEVMYSIPTVFGARNASIPFFQCAETQTADYDYTEGSAPVYANEIALGVPMAEELGAEIGDSLILTVNGKADEYIVTALFDTFSQLGKCGRLSNAVSIPDSQISYCMAFQIDFHDHPDAQTVTERIGKLKKLFSTDSVYNTAEYVDNNTQAASMVNRAKTLTMVIALLVTVMMCVLIESAFISNEKKEIALMKAIGFRRQSVIGIHICRFALIGLFSVLLGMLLHIPMTKLIINPVFSLLGAGNSIRYEINCAEAFLLIPSGMLAAILLSVLLTALHTNKIAASDISDIE